MSKVFPHVPETFYAVIVENKPRVIVFATETSLEGARIVCREAHTWYPDRRVIIKKYHSLSVHGRRTWEPKRCVCATKAKP